VAEASGNYGKHTSGNPLQRRLIDRFHRRVLDVARRTGATDALEVGCGEGFALRYLADHGGPARLSGIDLSPAAVDAARRLVPEVSVRVGDATALPFPDGSVDLVLCLEVLEHLADPGAALAEIRRVTGRYAIFSVPHEPWFRLANLLRGKNPSRWGDDPEHCQHWGRSGVARLVGEHFTVRSVETSFPWIVVLAERKA
jgi:SAM-dependent methyltransferase